MASPTRRGMSSVTGGEGATITPISPKIPTPGTPDTGTAQDTPETPGTGVESQGPDTGKPKPTRATRKPADTPPPADTPAGKVDMIKRSYYLPTALADDLEILVDDLHFGTRRPKWEALELVLRAGMEHKAEITKELKARGRA